MKKTDFIIIMLALSLFLILIVGTVSASRLDNGQIRPACQTKSRGIGEQIRPANQLHFPLHNHGNFIPKHGSHYKSKK